MANSITLVMRILYIGLLSLISTLLFCQNNIAQKSNKFQRFLSLNEIIEEERFNSILTYKDGKYIFRNFYVNRNGDLFLNDSITYDDIEQKSKTGYCKYYNDDGSIGSEGNFLNNKREGLWIFGDTLLGSYSIGSYTQGKKNGLWKSYDNHILKNDYHYKEDSKTGKFIIYDTSGTIKNEGEYSRDTILFQSRIAKIGDVEETSPMWFGCEEMMDALERKKCAEGKMLQFLYTKIRYPLFAKDNAIQGRALTTFVVEKDGTISNIKVRRGLCEDIKDGIFEVLNQFPKFQPGIQDGQAARVKFNLPIEFRLN